MKCLFSISALTLFAGLLQAQDSIPIGRVVYFQQVDLAGDAQNDGISILLFNPNFSQYAQHGAPTRDSSFSTPDYLVMNIDGDEEGFPIFKSHRERKLYSKILCRQSPRNHCVVSDTFATTIWTLHPEHRRFGQYDCRRATGHYRGRDYEAWYTLEVPIPTGPFKLGGLPGLILEATSLDGKVKFLFSSLEVSDRIAGTIRMPMGKDLGMSYQAYLAEREQYNESRIKAAKAKGFDLSITALEIIELNTEN
jgi:GLPGLI family protein